MAATKPNLEDGQIWQHQPATLRVSVGEDALASELCFFMISAHQPVVVPPFFGPAPWSPVFDAVPLALLVGTGTFPAREVPGNELLMESPGCKRQHM